jgi:hypothetical protein
MNARDDKRTMDELVREAREGWVPPKPGADAQDVAEQKLFAQIDAHEKLPRIGSGLGVAADRRFWGSVAAITAVAAAALLLSRSSSTPVAEIDGAQPTAPSPVESPRPAAPAELASVAHGGEVRVDGVGVVAHEKTLHDGQTVEARGDAVFTAAERVSWLLENGTDVGVVRSGAHGAAIVLALRVGAVEAEVVPVPGGEAFAVDVDGVRVAVHGTHLRVARAQRDGTHVVVDLSEGVISVGTPPKSGSTVGEFLINAPAHVEFSVADLAGTFHVDHDAASVRTPVDPVGLIARQSADETPAPPVASPTPLAAAAASPPPPPAPAAMGPRTPTAPAPKPGPAEVILAAVHHCADTTLGPPGSGALTISSTLTVDANPDGTTRLTSFDPPVHPDLQQCVAQVAYGLRWSEGGAHRIPIELHR